MNLLKLLAKIILQEEIENNKYHFEKMAMKILLNQDVLKSLKAIMTA